MNREYVLEKLAGYANTYGRILSFLGNKNAKAVIEPLKNIYQEALKNGKYAGSFRSFLKKTKGDRAAAETMAGMKGATSNADEGFSIFKPWSRKAKIIGGIAAAGAGGALGVSLASKKQQQPSEEEMYQMMAQQQSQQGQPY